MTRSHAGSPTPQVPKSITAASRPSRTNRFPTAMSPWNHTSGRSQVVASAASQTPPVVVVEAGEARPGLLVVRRERAAAVEAVLAGDRTSAGVHGPQRHQEPGQVARELLLVEVVAGGSTVDPAAYRPRPREGRGGQAERDRLGHGQRELWREYRQPAVLLRNARDVAVGRGQADGELGAEAVGAVVPPVRLDREYGEVLPLRELLGEQAAHEGGVDAGAAVGSHRVTMSNSGTGFKWFWPRGRFASEVTTK